ncbi:mannose-6-phosphate isomerase [Streptomyces agglomeratus]|uniref:Mannose-6-phosphate isomerase n=1 Tax=Streptomyces agglomeratus TaxID=285458 RepID=A0A1E5PAU5_9ACTN|nr:SIS domain-containing protein [Streptomyces agglomeratus]OEJ26607.1 mannose-6-phosphate isomerase [Streptomyces agglomeratus]OEJ39325.1 mannose-6-phosphate isomerase [Streptomyces agglomeratus]OEJ46291.1 mannose-6-phosphate isomerase [Streptomyces agglomeratus]OEJ51844.1 mannose-6-phosphate isomerase [Streptomyces agglomeratus]OEJ59252.1 mannose-6-phosphate isomerase [Streptomyces agglomeratus]
MLDESLLDDPESLARADRRGLLRGAAEAGARVRTAARHATEAGLAEIKPEGRPRAVLIAGPGTAANGVADLLAALAGAACPVTRLHSTGVAPAAGALRWALPGWAGSVDLLLLVTPDGAEPGLAVLAEQAYRRGCTVVAVAPQRSPLSESVNGVHGLVVPMATAPYEEYDEGTATGPGALWALLTPLLVLFDRLGLITAPPDTLRLVADRLDRTAQRCGPALAMYSNPAKTLASELADSLPLIWTEGAYAGPVGRRFAAVLAELAGRPALSAELPEALPSHGVLLSGAFAAGADPDDFFRDRVNEAQALHARVVLLRDRPTGGMTAAPAARELALSHDTAISEIEPEDGSELENLAEMLAITDFAAVYLALASAG